MAVDVYNTSHYRLVSLMKGSGIHKQADTFPKSICKKPIAEFVADARRPAAAGARGRAAAQLPGPHLYAGIADDRNAVELRVAI
eukprot:6192006-Pleurochrysis_carterae.AAC.4